MEVQTDFEAALALCVLRSAGIEIPSDVLHDLANGELGTLNSAASLGVATAALFEKWSRAERGSIETEQGPMEVFPETWELLIQATIDGFEQMREQVLGGWNDEMRRCGRERRLRLRIERTEGDLEELSYQHGGPLTDEVRRRHEKRERAKRTA